MTENLYMKKIGEKAKTASLNLSNLSINKKNSVLRQFIQYLKKNENLILNANKKDIMLSRFLKRMHGRQKLNQIFLLN